jgi:hypothetical protein
MRSDTVHIFIIIYAFKYIRKKEFKRKTCSPGDKLDEVVVEGNAGVGIEDAGAGVTEEVAGDNLVLCVAENALRGHRRTSRD